MTTKKISTLQFFSLLLLSRLLSMLTYTPSQSASKNTSDFLVSVLVGTLFICLCGAPALLLYHKYQNKDIIDLSYQVSPTFAKVTAIGYSILFLFFAFTTLARLDMFAGTIVFPDRDTTFFIILSIMLSCYAATLGLEALGRAGFISVFVFGISFFIILLTMFHKINLNYFSPIFYDGFIPILQDGWTMTLRTVELAAILVIYPKVSGNLKKGFFGWITAFFIFAEIIFFFLMGSLGEFSLMQIFPVHSIAVLSEFTVFERLDEILSGVWILSAFMKISFMLYLSSYTLSKVFYKKSQNSLIYFAGILIVIVQILTSKNIIHFISAIGTKTRNSLFPVFVVATPLLINYLLTAKKRKNDEQSS